MDELRGKEVADVARARLIEAHIGEIDALVRRDDSNELETLELVHWPSSRPLATHAHVLRSQHTLVPAARAPASA